MAENRRAVRIAARIKFSYEILGSEGAFGSRQNAVTKNIGAVGLLFESESEIPLGARLKIYISFPGQPSKLMEVEGGVVRIEKLLSSPNYNVGVTFAEISQDLEDEFRQCIERIDVLKLLKQAAERKASDLHLTVNSPPMMRLHGGIMPLEQEGIPLSSEEIKQMVYSILTPPQMQRFENAKDLDFAFSLEADLRYRASVYQQRGNVEVVFRIIPSKIKTRQELSLPPIIDDLCKLTNGIIVIAGTTGSGKTTTISAMIDIINRTRAGVILSLEKPIEYIHKNIKSVVKQREVGSDVSSFAAGLIAGLRQDPDVIVVGEISDIDTIETALNAAETGHLVISSIHAADTLQALDRIISIFPAEQQHSVAGRLCHCLKAVLTQCLLPQRHGYERIVATEICIVNYAVKRSIFERNFTQLNSIIQSNAQSGMHLMRVSIDKIYEQGLITGEIYEMFNQGTK